MAGYIVRRFIQLVFVIFFITVLLFVMMKFHSTSLCNLLYYSIAICHDENSSGRSRALVGRR